MIKFTAHTEAGMVIGLGLSAENCKRLVAGASIAIDVRQMVATGQVDKILLFGGDTESSMVLKLHEAGAIGPDTQVNKVDHA